MKIECFKAYDIRGQVPEQLNDEVAYRVGRAFADFLNARRVVVGHDIRQSSPSLTDAVVRGLLDAGVEVIHIGQCGTEEVYFATFELGVDGGICVTASHNPIDFNGMKLVREGSRPISGDSGLDEVKRIAETGDFKNPAAPGEIVHRDMRPQYIQHLLGYIDAAAMTRKLKVLVNAGNGGAGAVIDGLEPHLPNIEFIKMHHEPDGTFPHGIPNPLLLENQKPTSKAVVENGADIGIAWDGDFDRCFFFDAHGRFIEGYYLVGLLAESFLRKYAGAKIVHDPRLTWNTIDIVESTGGKPIQSKTGHAFIKERMRLEDAIYGGEMSAHHYFKAFAYCDNGNIPWLLLVELMCETGKDLAAMVDDRIARFPCSGEINRKVRDQDYVKTMLRVVEDEYKASAKHVDKTDGLSVEFDQWRFSLRGSSTEPLLRLNVESRGDFALMEAKRDELIAIIDSN